MTAKTVIKPFVLERLFDVRNTVKKFNANSVRILSCPEGAFPYVVRTSENNGQRGYLIEDGKFLNPGGTFSFGQDTATVFYQAIPYFTGDKIKVLGPKFAVTEEIAMYILTVTRKAFSGFSWGQNSYNETVIRKMELWLPVKTDGQGNPLTENPESTEKGYSYHDKGYVPDWDYMERQIKEFETERIRGLGKYLEAAGFKGCISPGRKENIYSGGGAELYSLFNVEKLFGKSTRGKRLKGLDRIGGKLPFVTAGEENEGISAYIGNDVEIFGANTSTIDMFGSAKYRGYQYGADDHVAVVHTEKLAETAALFVTACLHKSAHTGRFNYSNNFYAKDADALHISLPVQVKDDGKPVIDAERKYHSEGYIPDWAYMEEYIREIQESMLADVAEYLGKRLGT